MSEITSVGAGRRRRMRAEARRNVQVIVEAAVRVLSQNPDAGIGEIASAAGVTRQTVYAHYASRDALRDAAVDHVTAEALATMDEARLADGRPTEALIRFIDAGWRTFARYPLLLATPPTHPKVDRQRHQPVLTRLHRLIERGQHDGEFDRDLPVGWLSAAVIALGHAAAEQVTNGQMSAADAHAALRRSVLGLFGTSVDHPPD